MQNLEVERCFKEATINVRKLSTGGPIKTFPVARHLGLAAVSARQPRLLMLEDTEELFNLVLALKLSAQEQKYLLA